jgi:hypothetical protein
MHLCFRAPNRAAVDAFHAEALVAGGHGRQGSDGTITRTTTPPLCSIPTVTASRRFAIRRQSRLSSQPGRTTRGDSGNSIEQLHRFARPSRGAMIHRLR